MNKLIKELAREAFIKERKEFCADWKESELSEALLEDFQVVFEKFAELIVRECCDIFVELRTRPADLAVKDVKNTS